jgi:hypothetical protein
MLKTCLLFFFAGIIVSSCSTISHASNEGILIGEVSVDYLDQTGRIVLSNHGESFRGLQFLVNENNIELGNIVGIFSDGERQKFGKDLSLLEGVPSRSLGLEKSNSTLQAIEFSCRPMDTWMSGRATVVVYGIR